MFNGNCCCCRCLCSISHRNSRKETEHWERKNGQNSYQVHRFVRKCKDRLRINIDIPEVLTFTDISVSRITGMQHLRPGFFSRKKPDTAQKSSSNFSLTSSKPLSLKASPGRFASDPPPSTPCCKTRSSANRLVRSRVAIAQSASPLRQSLAPRTTLHLPKHAVNGEATLYPTLSLSWGAVRWWFAVV